VTNGVIPEDIRRACYELAALIGDGSEVENEANTSQKLQAIKAGSVALTYFRGAEGSSRRFPQAVHELVHKYLSGSSPYLSGVATGVSGESVTAANLGFNRGI